MTSYVFLAISSLLFSLQFLFNKKFQEENGEGLNAVLKFSVYVSLFGLIILLFLNKFKLELTLFSFIIAFIYSLIDITYNYASIKSFSTVNLGLYSVFAMLGGMILPFIYGILFHNEPLTLTKGICCIMIVFALFVTVSDNKRKNKSSVIWYSLVFVLNGMVGVLSTIHQNASENNVDSTSFIMITRIITIVICGTWLFLRTKKIEKISFKSLSFSAGFACFNSIGNLLVLIALLTLPSSVQYPIVTGGTMFFASIISLLRKEKFTYKNAVSILLSLAATIIITF